MNILHINTNDLRGGAAKVMMRLVESQRSLGCNSEVIVGKKESNKSYVYPFDTRKSQEIKRRSTEGYIDYDVLGSFELIKNPWIQQADVIHLHNIHGNYFHPYSLSILSHLKPTVWTLHDMQSVTGHCSYSFDCYKWLTGCGNCPYPQEYPAMDVDRSHLNWFEKKDIYNHSKIFITPVADWIGNIAQKGLLKDHPMEIILNGVDIETYKPMDKIALREKYGIPKNKIIIGAVANGGTFGQDRKGGKYIEAVINLLVESGYDVLLVNVGGPIKGFENVHTYHVGYLSSENEMSEVYNTFDLYLFPSLADTCPLVISEAMACGVPVVTFATGGIPELVQHGETGFVALQKDVNQLYSYTEMLIKDKDLREKFSKASRSYCIAHFDHKLVIKKYLDVYEKAIQYFQDRKTEILCFGLQSVPDIVKEQPEFLHSEKVKRAGIVKDSYKKAKIAIVSDGYEDISKADVIFVKRSNYIIEDGYFDTMLYKGISTDIISGDVVLKRKNSKPFFKNISPVIATKEMVDTSISSIFFSKVFFEENKQAILNGEIVKYHSIESFSVENISISINDFMKSKIRDRVYIYGAGTHTIELLNESSYLRDLVVKIIDRNPAAIGKILLDKYEIVALSCISENIPILISSASFENDIYEQLSTTVTNPLIKIYNN